MLSYTNSKSIKEGRFAYKSKETLEQTKKGVLEEHQEYYMNTCLWSIGLIAYRLRFEQYPFDVSSDLGNMLKAIDKNQGQQLSFPVQISEQLKDVLTNLLKADHKERITLQ